jgi:hypothetical protein
MAEQNRTHEVIRHCGGIVHSDGNIFFTNRYQFEHAASILLGYATVSVPVCSGDAQPLYPQLPAGVGEVRSQVSGGQVLRDGNEP